MTSLLHARSGVMHLAGLHTVSWSARHPQSGICYTNMQTQQPHACSAASNKTWLRPAAHLFLSSCLHACFSVCFSCCCRPRLFPKLIALSILSLQILRGVFYAAGQGTYNLNPLALQGNPLTGSAFPAQCSVTWDELQEPVPLHVLQQCVPQIFYSQSKFRFSLGPEEVCSLSACQGTTCCSSLRWKATCSMGSQPGQLSSQHIDIQ